MLKFLLLSFAVLLAIASAQTCQCRLPSGSCSIISSNGDGTCDQTPVPCTACVCDEGGSFTCPVVERNVLLFNSSGGSQCSIFTVESALCPDSTPAPPTPTPAPSFAQSACCWSWSDDDIFNNPCELTPAGFSASSITYGIANMSQSYSATYQGASEQTTFTQTVRYNLGGSVVNMFSQVMGTLAGNRIYEQSGTESFVPGGPPQTFTYTTTSADPSTAAITVTAASTGTRGQAFTFYNSANPTQTMNNQLSLTQTLFLLIGTSSNTATCLYVQWSA